MHSPQADRNVYNTNLKLMAESIITYQRCLKTMIQVMRLNGVTEDEIKTRIRSELQPFFTHKLTKTDMKVLLKGVI